MEKIVIALVSVYVFVTSIRYGLYELRKEKNKVGGLSIITFSLIAVIGSNIMVWIK